MTALRRSPLHEAHADLGARFTDFSGWDMPLQYEGTLSEHRAVRDGVGVFDVTHLGRFSLEGPEARSGIDRMLCNDLSRIEPGRAQYTMLLDDNGGVIDDVIVWWIEDERFIILPNAANQEAVMGQLATGDAGRAEDLRPQTTMLAVQGPNARSVVEEAAGAWPGRFRVEENDGMIIAGTGYTGESGVELVVPNEAAPDIFQRILGSGAVPCGLGARDTLRLEMGYPLWGQDLSTEISPLEAGLGWVVGWKADFQGKAALERQSAEGLSKMLVGFEMPGRRVPRSGYALRCGSSEGAVTSGNFSPTLERGIGMGYVSPVPEPDGAVAVEIRGEWLDAVRRDPPFVER